MAEDILRDDSDVLNAGTDILHAGTDLLTAGTDILGLAEVVAATFPVSAVVSDNFNRANETPIAGSWAALQYDGDVADFLGVFSNFAAAEGDSDCSSVWNVTVGADVDAYVTITAGKQISGNVICGIYLRLIPTDNAPSYVGLTVTRTAGAENWELVTSVGGTVTSHGVTAHAMAVNDKVGLRVNGTALTAYHFSAAAWAEVATATISTPSATGKAALRTQGNQTGFEDWTIAAL